MNPQTPSPYIQQILDDQGFKLIEVARYGPRYASLIVEKDGQTGFFKCSLPREEQELCRPANYFWTEHDSQYELDRRILREAKLLQFLSVADEKDFEPRIIAYSDTNPVWSLRTFVENNSFAEGDSTFAFANHFFAEVSPKKTFNVFHNIQSLSNVVPETVSAYIDLANKRQLRHAPHIQDALDYGSVLELFNDSDHEKISTIIIEAWRYYNQHTYVLTHGEAFPPHFIRNEDGVLGLIDWENASFDDALYDYSVIYLRTFTNPPWQQQFYDLIEQHNYFADTGAKRWQAELVVQSLLNHRYLSNGGSFGDDDYNRRALAFFEATLRDQIK